MDGYLAENLQHIPKFLAQDRDIIMIVSGRGKTRTGKSTIAAQIAAYADFLLRGGRMDLRRDPETKRFIHPVILKKPVGPPKFTLDNVFFDVEKLMEVAPKSPKNSIFIVDESRSGNDSKSSMNALNRRVEIFFDECGALNNFIILVLPDYFTLSANIATSRSMFLVDVYCDENWKRGYFNFFNEVQKEFLFWMGKKVIGSFKRYTAANPNFFGRFPDFLPFDRPTYNARKLEAIKKRRITSREAKTRAKLGAALSILKEEAKFTTSDVASKMSFALSQKITDNMIKNHLKDYTHHLNVVEKRDLLAKT